MKLNNIIFKSKTFILLNKQDLNKLGSKLNLL